MSQEEVNQPAEQAGGELEQLPEIRRILDDNIWYYSITDVIEALTGTSDPSDYWLNRKSEAGA